MATQATVWLRNLQVQGGAFMADVVVVHDPGGGLVELATQKTFGVIPVGLTDSGVTAQLKAIAAGVLLEFAGRTVATADIVRIG